MEKYDKEQASSFRTDEIVSSRNSEKKNHKIANTLKIMKITLYFFLVWLFAFQNEKRHKHSKLL